MSKPPWLPSTLLFIGVSALIILNLNVLLNAYTASLAPICCDGSKLTARDFGAYYEALWQLFHFPSQIYTHWSVGDGGPVFYPAIEQYKYLPSFLILISPLSLLGYKEAIIAFDGIQFALLPVMALLVYKLTKENGLWAVFVVATIVLLLPLPWPGWNISMPYFWLWREGQAKVIETFLLLGSFYFGKVNRPAVSGVLLALAFFDLRFGLVALPLFIMYNKSVIRSATLWFYASLAATNAILLYPGVGSGFLTMVFSTGLTTFFYPYAFIPLLTVFSLWFLNRKQVEFALRDVAGWLGLALANALPTIPKKSPRSAVATFEVTNHSIAVPAGMTSKTQSSTLSDAGE